MANSPVNDTSQQCPVVNQVLFDLGCLGPALAIICVLACYKQRVKFKLQKCNGYPGLVTPFNFLGGFSNRFTIAITFGATASSCLLMFFNPKNGLFQMTDPAGWVKVFQNVATVLVYGILFYPFFACLTTKNKLVGSLMGFLYVTIRLKLAFFRSNSGRRLGSSLTSSCVPRSFEATRCSIVTTRGKNSQYLPPFTFVLLLCVVFSAMML